MLSFIEGVFVAVESLIAQTSIQPFCQQFNYSLPATPAEIPPSSFVVEVLGHFIPNEPTQSIFLLCRELPTAEIKLVFPPPQFLAAGISSDTGITSSTEPGGVC